MQRVEMKVRQKEKVTLTVTERIASYDQMMVVLKTYVDDLLASVDTGGVSNVTFCETLPETGSEDTLYIVTSEPAAYIWDASTEKFEPLAGQIESQVASDDEVDEAMDETFSDSSVATDEDIAEALEETFGS